jgi:hypothetical protein
MPSHVASRWLGCMIHLALPYTAEESGFPGSDNLIQGWGVVCVAHLGPCESGNDKFFSEEF